MKSGLKRRVFNEVDAPADLNEVFLPVFARVAITRMFGSLGPARGRPR